MHPPEPADDRALHLVRQLALLDDELPGLRLRLRADRGPGGGGVHLPAGGGIALELGPDLRSPAAPAATRAVSIDQRIVGVDREPLDRPLTGKDCADRRHLLGRDGVRGERPGEDQLGVAARGSGPEQPQKAIGGARPGVLAVVRGDVERERAGQLAQQRLGDARVVDRGEVAEHQIRERAGAELAVACHVPRGAPHE